MGLVRSRLAWPMPHFRASLIDNRLYMSPRGLQEYDRKKQKNSSTASSCGENFAQSPRPKYSLEDDVFPDQLILDELVQRAVEAMPSDSSDEATEEEKQIANSSDLEEAASVDIPPEATINEEEWEMPAMEEGQLQTPSKEKTSLPGSGHVHKTWSYPGRDATAPRMAQNPLATLPRSSQVRILKNRILEV